MSAVQGHVTFSHFQLRSESHREGCTDADGADAGAEADGADVGGADGADAGAEADGADGYGDAADGADAGADVGGADVAGAGGDDVDCTSAACRSWFWFLLPAPCSQTQNIFIFTNTLAI